MKDPLFIADLIVSANQVGYELNCQLLKYYH